MFRLGVVLGMCVLLAPLADAQQPAGGSIRGRVTDETGGVLPGVTVALRTESQQAVVTVTGPSGDYTFSHLTPGTYQLSLTLINFASVNLRDLKLAPGATVVNNETMHLSMNADVVVVGKRTFTNLADVAEPAEDLPRKIWWASRRPRAMVPSPRNSSTSGRSCDTVRSSKRCPASSSRSIAARGRRTSISCAASTLITAAISP